MVSVTIFESEVDISNTGRQKFLGARHERAWISIWFDGLITAEDPTVI